MFNELLKLEVLLAENKEKEDFSKFIEENHNNLDALMMNTFVKPKNEEKVKKFNIKWKPNNDAKQEIKQDIKSLFELKQKNISSIGVPSQNTMYGQTQGNIKENIHKPPEIPIAAKAVVPAG